MTGIALAFILSPAFAGESCVWQVFESSFTASQMSVIQDVLESDLSTAREDIQKFRLVRGNDITAFQAECRVEKLSVFKTALQAGKIRRIGKYVYGPYGYARLGDWNIIKGFWERVYYYVPPVIAISSGT